jgi:hypothetical protein
MLNEDRTGVEKTKRQDEPEGKASGTEQPPVHPSSARAVAELVIFYLGIPALTLYPFGITLFWLQIMYNYSEGNESAGYAVSLIPRTTVILEATFDLTQQASLFLLFGAPVALFFSLVFTRGWSFVWGTGWRRNPIRRLLFLLVSTAYGLWIFALLLAFIFALIMGDVINITTAAALLLSIPGSVLGGYVVGKDYRNSKRSKEQGGPIIPARRWLLRGLALWYASAVVILWIFAGLGQAPDLPAVKVGGDKEIEGLLLGVNGGHWHILDQEGRILAVPVDQIGTVTICPTKVRGVNTEGREFPGVPTDC